MRFTWGRPNRQERSRTPFVALTLMFAGGLLVTAAGSAAAQEGQPAKSFLYVANQFDDNVSVIDVDAKKVIGTVPVGKARRARQPPRVGIACTSPIRTPTVCP
jgi:40-residue YVTN family beta-propeller repeat